MNIWFVQHTPTQFKYINHYTGENGPSVKALIHYISRGSTYNGNSFDSKNEYMVCRLISYKAILMACYIIK